MAFLDDYNMVDSVAEIRTQDNVFLDEESRIALHTPPSLVPDSTLRVEGGFICLLAGTSDCIFELISAFR